MNNKAYNALKFTALVLLPGLGALYIGVAAIWGLPAVDEVSQTVVVVDTFLGLLVRYFSEKHKNSDDRFDGQINVIQEAGVKKLELEPFIDPGTFEAKDQIVFKMNPINLDDQSEV